jgi:hypothetical protein
MFDADDAQRIFEQLAPAEAAKAGRDFVYTSTKTDGSKVTGQVVSRDAGHLKLVVDDSPYPTAADVEWDEIEAISIVSSRRATDRERQLAGASLAA